MLVALPESQDKYVETLRVLVDAGAQMDDATQRQVSEALGGVSTVAKHGAAALTAAAERGDQAAVCKLVAAGTPVDALDAEGWTALTCAAFAGHTAVVTVLLGLGASLTTTKTAPPISSPLMVAAQNGKVEVVQALVAAGAAVCWQRPSHEDTAVDDAALAGHAAVVAALLELGADVNHRCRFGHTALSRAALGGHLEVVQELLHPALAPGSSADPLLPLGSPPRQLCWQLLCSDDTFSAEEHGRVAEVLLHCTLRAVAERLQRLRAAGSTSAAAWAARHEGRPWRDWVKDLLGSTTELHMAVLCADVSLVTELAQQSAPLLTQRTGGVMGGANCLTPLELAVDVHCRLPVRAVLLRVAWALALPLGRARQESQTLRFVCLWPPHAQVCLAVITPLLGQHAVQQELHAGVQVPSTPACAANVYGGASAVTMAVARRDVKVLEALLENGGLAQERNGAPLIQAVGPPVLPM